MKLFEEIDRTYMGPAGHNENPFDFYNRSSSQDVTIIRNKLNEWFDLLPETEHKEFKARFYKSFYPTFYELFLFQLFSNLGFSVEFHPEVPNSTKRPDFLIAKDGLEIYVEAKVANDKSTDQQAFERKLNEFYDSIDKLRFDRFLIRLTKVIFKTREQPTLSGLKTFIKDTLDNLDPDQVAADLTKLGRDAIKDYIFDNEQLYVSFNPIPLIPDAKNDKDKRVIGILPSEAYFDGAEESLKDSISLKAKRYGELDKPFLVCINALSENTTSRIDVDNAIYGSLAISFPKDPAIRDDKWVRMNDGTFRNNKGARLLNLSGVLVTKIFPFNIPNAKYWLYEHPFTDNKLDFEKLGLKCNYVVEGDIIQSEGDNLHEILGIEKDWLKI